MPRRIPPQSPSSPQHPATPANRGPLMFPEDVRTSVFQGKVSNWWVRRNVAPTKKIRLGHSTVAWYEADVYEWLDGRMGR